MKNGFPIMNKIANISFIWKKNVKNKTSNIIFITRKYTNSNNDYHYNLYSMK